MLFEGHHAKLQISSQSVVRYEAPGVHSLGISLMGGIANCTFAQGLSSRISSHSAKLIATTASTSKSQDLKFLVFYIDASA